eukprot:jgi/Botrbrau1/13314/Bobra.0315s0012.1
MRMIVPILLCVCCLGTSAVREFSVPDVRSLLRQMSEARSLNRVWMSVHEQMLIESYLDENNTMLEYGSGYSTLWFSQFVKYYYSIEHARDWFDIVKAEIRSLPNVEYRLAAVDPGYRGWPGGFSEGNYEQFEEYIKAVDGFVVQKFDRVLIDGRARAFCAKYILKYLHENSYIFIHDYEGRAMYHENLDAYYTKIAIVFRGQSVVVARPKLEVLQAIKEGNFVS